MTKTLPFSHKRYSKHDMAVFPTIRRRDKYGDVGDTVEVVAGPQGARERRGDAEIIAKNAWAFGEIPNKMLIYDTESATLPEAKDSIQSFYRNPIKDDEEVTVYWLKWIERVGDTDG